MSKQTSERLVYMANQIARYFATQPGDVAALQTADHLKAYWEPRMRRQIFDLVDGGGGQDLSPVAAAAVALLRQASAQTVSAALVRRGEPTARAPGDDAG